MIQDNPFDLTAGIPAVGNGNLSLSGTWGAAAAMGSANVTINAGDLQVYVWTVQMDTGDTPEMYQPRTFPNWQMQSPSLSATSGVFVSNAQVPSGDFLHSVYSMTTNGSNNPRNDDVLSGFQLYDQRNGRDIITFGGLRDDIRQYKPYEILSQEDRNAWPPSEVEGALSVPTITAVADSGLGWLDIHNYVDKRKALAQYGADLRQLATGDLLIKYGIVDATGSALNLLFRKYQLNPDHPANAGL
ncbi:MAG: hypothetical protein Q7O66_19590 [Dehalococcoidia bacterium]|nr:hypothetical protein [Dehalococcoidia bacterium]